MLWRSSPVCTSWRLRSRAGLVRWGAAGHCLALTLALVACHERSRHDAATGPVRADCTLGALGCPCDEDRDCVSDDSPLEVACEEKRCVHIQSERPLPAKLECFTPCTDDLVQSDGTVRTCDAEGLMRGCIGAAECVRGSCMVPPRSRASALVEKGAKESGGRSCKADDDCPDFQGCLEGICASECEIAGDCPAGFECRRKVCRAPCRTGDENACPSGFVCTSEDGNLGVCLKGATSAGAPPAPPRPEPRFSLSTHHIALSNKAIAASFTITNESESPLPFKVRRKDQTNIGREGRVAQTKDPLFWLMIGPDRELTRAQELEVLLGAGESREILIREVANGDLSAWEGHLEVFQGGSGSQSILLTYSTAPDGLWSGQIYYLANFDEGGKGAMDAFAADPASRAAAEGTHNALLAQWSEFVRSDLFSLEQWTAVLNATLEGTWDFPLVREGCEEGVGKGSMKRCYPFVSPDGPPQGLGVYTDSASLRVPTGVLAMPFAMTLKQASFERPLEFSGAVQSQIALQYPDQPGVRLTFGKSPGTCEGSGRACLVPVKQFSLTSYVGSRRPASDAAPCGGGGGADAALRQPWLLPTFTQGTEASDQGLVRTECRDTGFPFEPGSQLGRFRNMSLSGANPVPDGQRRKRQLDLIDGRLINQDTLFLIVRERFDARMEGARDATIAGYGLVMLKRTPAQVDAEDFIPSPPPKSSAPPPAAPLVDESGTLSCPELDLTVTADSAEKMVAFLIDGQTSDDAPKRVDDSSEWKAYYLCHDTGRFNGGNPAYRNKKTPDTFPEECPSDSKVTYFLYRGADDLAADKCQGKTLCSHGLCAEGERGTCEKRLALLRDTRAHELVLDPVHQCKEEGATGPDAPVDSGRVYCDGDRKDLLAEKVFYEPVPATTDATRVMSPLLTTVADAFQYRTRFTSASGKRIGFVPDVCELGVDAKPFCYDPAKIELARARIDCVTRIYRVFGDRGGRAQPVITTAFGGESDRGVDGFESMYGELMLMLGDDAYVRALGSRFDISESATGSFDGAAFEPDGIALSGGAGYEMRSLYQARQAYELVLDRFYRQSGVLWEDVSSDTAAPRLVRAATITNYLGKVVLASSQEARVTSEIAKRYQGFGRPDLARHVIERGFARAYLESLLLNQLFKEYSRVVPAAELDQLRQNMGRTQNLYRISLELMRETYSDLTDELTFFGDPPDYIPFPSPRHYDIVSPQIMLERAAETMGIAKERDERAIFSRVQGGVAPAQFQSELRRVELEYENQLGDLCGTFPGPDGQPLPAIPKFAKQDPVLSMMAVDPCGLVGNGIIHDARGEVEIAATDLRIAVQEMRDILERASIEQRRVDLECQGAVDLARLTFNAAGTIITLEDEQRAADREISSWERELAEADRATRVATSLAATSQQIQFTTGACVGAAVDWNPFQKVQNAASCAAGVAATAAYGAATAAEIAATHKQRQFNEDAARKQAEIHEASRRVSDIQRTTEAQQRLSECEICPAWSSEGVDPVTDEVLATGDLPECPGPTRPGPLRIESQARIDTLMVDVARAKLNGLRAQLNLSLAEGRREAFYHRAQRLMAQAEESEQMLIAVEAQQNDPNLRLLRNADVIDADRAFHDALVDAYRATRVVEYYTAQSYGPKSQLFLARLAARGEYSIENYLLDLQRFLHEFENIYGRPSKRVHVVSLRDDILRIPRIDKNGVPLSDSERIGAMRKALVDPARLNSRGYLSFPFSVGPDATSPLTSVHKVEHVEAEIQGSGVGDRLGRVYVTSRGTATLRDLDAKLSFLRLPPITAVVDAFFNGVKPVFVDPEVYQDMRLRERPLLNSLWELGLNLRDEQVNQDINIEELTDVRLYLYYEDFTQLR